jgi:hypothetical protein
MQRPSATSSLSIVAQSTVQATVPDLEEAAYRYSSPRSLYVPSDGEQSTERLSNPPCDAQHPILTYMCIPLMATSKRWSRPPSPIRGSGPVHSRTLHFHFEHQEASPGRPRQTKSTHIPLTRSNRRHGQYVESCCALELGGILIFPQSQRTRLSTTRARRLTRTGTKSSTHDRTRRPIHRRTDEQYTGKRMRKLMEEPETNANAHTVSTSPRPTDTLRSRVLTPSSVATTSTLSTAP